MDVGGCSNEIRLFCHVRSHATGSQWSLVDYFDLAPITPSRLSIRWNSARELNKTTRAIHFYRKFPRIFARNRFTINDPCTATRNRWHRTSTLYVTVSGAIQIRPMKAGFRRLVPRLPARRRLVAFPPKLGRRGVLRSSFFPKILCSN